MVTCRVAGSLGMRVDNCPHDILASICDHLSTHNDRAAVALTSSSLHAAVLPHLYSVVYFDPRQDLSYKGFVRYPLWLLSSCAEITR
jgi:hypothetical protein